MLSHDNIYWVATIFTQILCGSREGKDVVVSYLPLSHILAQMMDIWMAINSLGTVVFADKMALKGTLLNTLKEARPTNFLGVPRVWEKIMEGLKEKGKDTRGLKKSLVNACKIAALEYHLKDKHTIMYKFGQHTIYKKVQEAIGLDRCLGLYTGGAPCTQETIKYFLSLDMLIYDGYGMTESTGALSVYDPYGLEAPSGTCSIMGGTLNEKIKLGSNGKTFPGSLTKLANLDTDGVGEICTKGRNVMMGYLNCEDKTKETVDEFGWLHAGDMGSIDTEGYLYITG